MCLPLASQQCSEKCGESSRETLSKGIANNHKSFVVVQNFKIKKQKKKTSTQEFFYSYNIMLKTFGKKKRNTQTIMNNMQKLQHVLFNYFLLFFFLCNKWQKFSSENYA